MRVKGCHQDATRTTNHKHTSPVVSRAVRTIAVAKLNQSIVLVEELKVKGNKLCWEGTMTEVYIEEQHFWFCLPSVCKNDVDLLRED